MTQANPTQVNTKQVEKLIKSSAKKVISASGVASSTRRGNKEFNRLVKKLSQQPVSTSGQATEIGEDLGQRVVALSQKLGRKSLDRGVIQQLMIQGDLPSLAEVPKGEPGPRPLPAIQEPASSQNIAATTLTQPPQESQPGTLSGEESGSTEEATEEKVTLGAFGATEEVVSADVPELVEQEEEQIEEEQPTQPAD